MIFYFSATGNCLDAANRLAGSFGDKVLDIVEELKGGCNYHLEEGEKVGIVSPVHFYGLPMIVEDFIGRMRFDRTPYLYLVLTYGTTPGQAMQRAERVLAKSGYGLDSKLGVKMPENYVLMFDPPNDTEAKRILGAAYDRISVFADSVRDGKAVDMTDPVGVLDRITGIIARPMYDHGRGTGRFYVDTICTGCGKCVRVCPSKAIELIDRIPTWTKSKCLRCCACINRCPFKALQFGRSTKKRGRYVNPNVDIPDRE
ncbi:MAG: EFR1 family ferrodoxin [Candidatus Methanomethylophilaceae archaeon]|nr:EFR1 family ferrodoxin [Candidatus Methanomethylophilaceae archaeon]MBQ6547342.1 EFR1 family ferrodoxin [Candidatus Methanomethylophilaceae archaeon]